MVVLSSVVRIPNGNVSLKYSLTSNRDEIWLLMFGHVDFNSTWLTILTIFMMYTIIDHVSSIFMYDGHFDIGFLMWNYHVPQWLIHNKLFIKIYVTLWHSQTIMFDCNMVTSCHIMTFILFYVEFLNFSMVTLLFYVS